MKLLIKLAVRVTVVKILDCCSVPILKLILRKHGVKQTETSPRITEICKQFNVNPRSIARLYDINAGRKEYISRRELTDN